MSHSSKDRNIAIVTPFALEGKEDVDFSALASYTKTLISTFPQEIRSKVVVVAQRELPEKSYTYDSVLVERVWRKESFLYFLDIFRYCQKRNVKIVHIQHEIYGYGTSFTPYVSPFMMPLLILLLRFTGINVVTTIHGVVDTNTLSPDFAQKNRVSGGTLLIKIGLSTLFILLVIISSKVVVHNENIKQLLVSRFRANTDKIQIIPLPLYEYSGEKHTAKIFFEQRLLNKKVILFFGYLADYKGLDIFIETFRHFDLEDNDSIALIAGAVPKRLEADEEYNDWLNKLEETSHDISPNIIWQKKFIQDSKLESYFQNAEIVAIPYKHALSSSGPLAHAVKLKRPLAVSSVFKGAVEEALIYGYSPVDLAGYLNKYYNNQAFKKVVVDAVEKQNSLWNNVAIGNLTCELYKSS